MQFLDQLWRLDGAKLINKGKLWTSNENWTLIPTKINFTWITKQNCFNLPQKSSKDDSFNYIENKSRNKFLGVSIENFLGETFGSSPEYMM